MNPWTGAAAVALLRAGEAILQWQAREPYSPIAAAHLRALGAMRQEWVGQQVKERVRAHVPAPRGGTGG